MCVADKHGSEIFDQCGAPLSEAFAMARIDGFRVKNFRVFKEITLGKLWTLQSASPLSAMTAVIGKNGVGKSTLFDAFGFLSDCLKSGVEEACDLRGRGGFDRIRSQGQDGPIEFEVYYREEGKARPITYELSIDLDAKGRPYVQRERLRQRRKGQKQGRPFSFLVLNEGRGVAWKGEWKGEKEGIDEKKRDFDLLGLIESVKGEDRTEESRETEIVELEDKRRLGIATLGTLRQHPRISAFRRFIEGWYLSYFTPDAARGLPLAGPQKHLNVHGDNLGNVVQFLEREHPKRFAAILEGIAQKIPGIYKIDTEKTPDGRLLLKFNDKGFTDPFYAQQMSDGTLKIFAYLLLLEDPTPPPFLCIEEPENGLYHKLLETLAREFREHADAAKGGSQVFVTTHQPYFVDAMLPEEVWVLEKGAEGFSTIRRASNDSVVKNMAEEGLPLGGLWYSDYLDAR
jgi:predicted ATPase